MSVFFEQLEKTDNISDFKKVDKNGNTVCFFRFNELFSAAEQTATEHITASRIVLNFNFEKPKTFNKLKIFEFANLINSKLPGLKATVKNISHQKIDITFSLEYLLPDYLFINVNFNNDLEIISAGSVLFEEMLKGTKGILDS